VSRVDQGPDAVDPPPKPDRGPDPDARGGRGEEEDASLALRVVASRYHRHHNINIIFIATSVLPLGLGLGLDWASGAISWHPCPGRLEVSRVDQGPDHRHHHPHHLARCVGPYEKKIVYRGCAIDPPPKPDRGPDQDAR
jgi:hypothetical protein